MQPGCTYIGPLSFSGQSGEGRCVNGMIQINSDADKLANMEVKFTGTTSFPSSHLIASARGLKVTTACSISSAHAAEWP